MNEEKKLVLAKFLDRGILKYKGVQDHKIESYLHDLGWNYKAFKFEDSRVLLVHDTETFGVLYNSEKALYKDLDSYAQNI